MLQATAIERNVAILQYCYIAILSYSHMDSKQYCDLLLDTNPFAGR